MALASNALTNVATMELVLGLASGSADVALQRAINQASAIADSYAGRIFARNTAVSEKQEGNHTPIMRIAQPPLNSITSVSYLGTAEDSTSYEIHDANRGQIFRINSNWGGLDSTFPDSSATLYTGVGRKVWTIVYDGGWYTAPQDDDDVGVTRNLPYDIEQAAIAIAVALYRAEGRDPGLASESLMEASQSYVTTPADGSSSWLEANVPGAAAILKRYRIGMIA